MVIIIAGTNGIQSRIVKFIFYLSAPKNLGAKLFTIPDTTSGIHHRRRNHGEITIEKSSL
jgi:hypothetical protein